MPCGRERRRESGRQNDGVRLPAAEASPRPRRAELCIRDRAGTDAFALYAPFGGNANAFTSFTSKVYLFSCTEHFDENLRVLLSFVTSPHFTEETVRKEQGIIGEEIKMYIDNPSWRVYFNLLRALYVHHPVRVDIAGTVESIAQITPEIL